MIVWCEGIRLVKMEVPRKTKLIVFANAFFLKILLQLWLAEYNLL
jgi:hypothetical protein